MKQLFVFLFLLIALTVDVPAANSVYVPETKPHLSGHSAIRYVPVVGLSEMEKANNALARVFGRTPPHAEPVLVQIINYPSQK